MRSTWNGWGRTRRWKASLPDVFTMYLLHAMRAASSDSEETCSFSSETRWHANGNSSTGAFLRPASKMRIFGSGTPRLYRDLGYALFFWYLRHEFAVGDARSIERSV
jgi:hypothetical protein